jgi:acetoin utilization deacetylase AcuC-like enzyme
VDTDVHQGIGTALIYSQDPETFTYSIHQERNYPLKQRSDLDDGLPDGVEDDEYLSRLALDLDRVDERFPAPELICYVAGVDPYRLDRLGGLRLTRDGVRRRDAFVMHRFVSRAVPVAIFLAGGYAPDPETTARLHLGTAWAAEEACAA